MIEASIITAFYNKIDFLNLVFAGLDRQSVKNFEVIIADDGSNEDSVAKLVELKDKVDFPVKHVWQEDEGWRKNEILNKAVVQSSSDYLIFIDADCIPHQHFVREHLKNKRENTILAGRRANLTKEKTEALTFDLVKRGYLEKAHLNLIMDGLRKKTRHPEKSLYIKSKLIRNVLQRRTIKLLGCNFSMHRSDLLSLNGFDERYKAPTYGEDVDLELRALNAGMKVISVSNMAIQYHLYHKLVDRQNNNVEIYDQNKALGMTKTPYGIDKI